VAPILIRGPAADAHVRAVRWALAQRGCDSLLWSSDAFPARQHLTIAIDPDDGPATLSLAEDALGRRALDGFRVVWNRRHGRPVLPAALPEEEHAFAERECRTMLSCLLEQLAGDALWVNPLSAQRRDIDKPHQLRTAVAVGLPIAPTVFSNDPDEITRFYERHGGAVIYKPFAPGKWPSGDNGLAVTYTSPVPRGVLDRRDILASAPGIYQKRLDKRDEWRVTMFGRSCFAVRLLSQEHPSAAMDWRAAPQELELEACDPPEWLTAACRRYLERDGLHFATFDFVRTPSDDFVFLEANQGGQFLWKEARLPDMPLLAAFTDFLLSADPDYRWQRQAAGPNFADYMQTEDFADMKAAFEAGLGRRRAS